MNQKIKKGIVFGLGVPLLAYFCFSIYSDLFPDSSPSGNAPASMDSLPKLPEPAVKPQAANPPKTPTNPAPANPAAQNPAAPQKPQPAKPNPTQGKPAPQKKEDEKKDQPIVLASSSLFGENPFVEMTILSEEHKAEQGKFPAIPSNIPVPNVSNIPIPPPPSGISVPTPAAAPPVVTGTIEASNGAKISLMSDGQVITDGDSSDGHIAYIGGGNAKFDDGKSLDDLINSIKVTRKQ